MAGSTEGGLKAAQTNKTRYGSDFYKNIGAKGGRVGTTGGFAYGDNAAKFGKLGGVASKRSRNITSNSTLRNDEINVLIPLTIRALGTLRMNGVITVMDEHALHPEVYERAARNDWKYMFRDMGVGPAIEIAWVSVLSTELATYKEQLSSSLVTGIGMMKKDADRYRIVRNLAKAFEVATGTKVK